MSLVSLRHPDFERYPKFREALAAAQSAEVGPGDAVFIPPLWWHHVESLEPFNVLVNYWWHDLAGDGASADSAFDALVYGILSIRALPPATRRAWGALFDQYVFGEDAGILEHISPERHGILGTLSAEQLAGLRAHLAKRLARGRDIGVRFLGRGISLEVRACDSVIISSVRSFSSRSRPSAAHWEPPPCRQSIPRPSTPCSHATKPWNCPLPMCPLRAILSTTMPQASPRSCARRFSLPGWIRTSPPRTSVTSQRPMRNAPSSANRSSIARRRRFAAVAVPGGAVRAPPSTSAIRAV